MNASGCDVSTFKVPTEEEWRLTFLARSRPRLLRTHQIFNRSHYETCWSCAYTSCAGETGAHGTVINNSRACSQIQTHHSQIYCTQQDGEEKRLLEREEEAEKFWKLSAGDGKSASTGMSTLLHTKTPSACAARRTRLVHRPGIRMVPQLAISEAVVDALSLIASKARTS